MARFKNMNWNLTQREDGGILTWEQAGIAVLMDIRDELQQLNRLVGCCNFLDIPAILRTIQRNTTKPRKRRKAKTA